MAQVRRIVLVNKEQKIGQSSFGMRKIVSSVIDPLFWCIKGDRRRHVRLRVM